MTLEEFLQWSHEQTIIRCPYCKKVQSDEGFYLVTYWGEDGPSEWDCQYCEKTFYVMEEVKRTYKVGKKLNSIDDIE